jgi:hypothetical protein
VTRLGEFFLTWRLLNLGRFLILTEVSQNFGLLFKICITCTNFDIQRVGLHFGANFFANLSGHPEDNVKRVLSLLLIFLKKRHFSSCKKCMKLDTEKRYYKIHKLPQRGPGVATQ